MANPNVASGLKPVKNVSGAPQSGAARVYSVPSSDGTAIFIGDAVKLVGTGQTINGVTFADVAQAATGDVMVGVVVGVLPDTRDSLTYRAASTQRLLLVVDDPDALFEIQEDSVGGSLAANDLGQNASLIVASGSTVTGLSGTMLDSSTHATTNTLDLKIVAFVNRPDNDIGTNAKWHVRINRHAYANQIAGV